MLDNIFTSMQQYVGGTLVSLSGLAVIFSILAVIADKVLDYLLRYVHEDSTKRIVILDFIYKGKDGKGTPREYLKEWIDFLETLPKNSPIKDVVTEDNTPNFMELFNATYGRFTVKTNCDSAIGGCKFDTVGVLLRSLRKQYLLYSNDFVDTRWQHFIISTGKCSLVVCILGWMIFFLPMWLLVTAGTVYGTLRLARFSVRTSKKLMKHMSDGHGGTQDEEDKPSKS